MQFTAQDNRLFLGGALTLALFFGYASRGRWSAEQLSAEQDQAAKILKTTGVQGGFIVHMGCGDARLTAALRAGEAYTVQGLTRNSAEVQAARQRLSDQGVYGTVSVEHLRGARLPYADNLINLLVVHDALGIEEAEMLRVVAPGGIACFSRDGGWEKRVKPRPPTIDEWTHYLHDAGNNPVARDQQVGPPRCVQWIAPPLWLRSHETPSGIEGLVSAKGRIFYFFDEGVVGITDQRLPERWALLCRDAFNGKLLWRQPLDSWGWPEWAADKFAGTDWTQIRGARTVVPTENHRRLVADGERLYATLSYQAPLSILDAGTGKLIATVKETEPVRELLASDGIVLVHSRQAGSDQARRRGAAKAKPSTLTAVEGQTGKVLWKTSTGPIADLFIALDHGRIICQAGSQLVCLTLKNGEKQWQVPASTGKGRALIAYQDKVLHYAQSALKVFDASSGKLLWQKDVPSSPGAEGEDLFVANGLVWRGMIPVNEKLETSGKSADALAIGLDLQTGEERKRIFVPELRSPEHHHRCYRNKATERFIISGMEGAEFMDLTGDQHGQNNWLRGACRLGVVPCNGLLYAPADQCFCEPGAKLLGFAAIAPENASRQKAIPDSERLEKGPAYGGRIGDPVPVSEEDWPTFRHDAMRHATTPTQLPSELAVVWKTRIQGRATAPITVGDRLYVAARDAHAVMALDAKTGQPLWTHVTGGRIDSPPTYFAGMLLFGSADGRVNCVRAADGALVWRFLAAPQDCRIGYFDQLESVWPVHGSVLVRDKVVYASAGRSTYLDGGIRVYGLDPYTGEILHQTRLEGPFADIKTARDVSFYVLGANSDVLVSEGEYLFMRQKKLTPDLQEVTSAVLTNKGEQDVGLHVFSTGGLLDDSGYNRIFWMYARRWPGFQLANQAPKCGQLLVVDDHHTYAVNMFYRRNVHSPLFFPAKEGFLLFADKNGNEPQIVGEPGARKPVEWLPQSHIPREGEPGLDSPAFGLDKMIGYTRAELPVWKKWMPVRVQAMVKAADRLVVCGPPDTLAAEDPYASFEGRQGAILAVVSAENGETLTELKLDAPPVFDGLIAARNRLYITQENGNIVCLGASP